MTNHTVEKIGGTSMSRLHELRDTLFIGDRTGDDLYNRIFVVSAFGGITDLLLEHKKTGEPGVYALFANCRQRPWLVRRRSSRVAEAMATRMARCSSTRPTAERADDFVRERIEGARSCLIDLQRLCSYGHFRLTEHMMMIRELLSGLGEAHSAFVTDAACCARAASTRASSTCPAGATRAQSNLDGAHPDGRWRTSTSPPRCRSSPATRSAPRG